MKKIVRLTESDLVRIVKRVLNEQTLPQEFKVGEIYSAIRFYNPSEIEYNKRVNNMTDEQFTEMGIGKEYKIKIEKVGETNYLVANIIGPGSYDGKRFPQYLELTINRNENTLSGNMSLGSFNKLKKIK